MEEYTASQNGVAGALTEDVQEGRQAELVCRTGLPLPCPARTAYGLEGCRAEHDRS